MTIELELHLEDGNQDDLTRARASAKAGKNGTKDSLDGKVKLSDLNVSLKYNSMTRTAGHRALSFSALITCLVSGDSSGARALLDLTT